MICFYHNDADGICAGYLVNVLSKNNEGRRKFIEMNYDVRFPFGMIGKDETVYIVDYSISPEEMDHLFEITENVIWIDHHISAINKYKDYKREIKGFRYDGIAACMLTYCYLKFMTDGGIGDVIKEFDESMVELAPMFIKYIADHDVWKFKYEFDTRAFILAFNAECLSPRNLRKFKHIEENTHDYVNSGYEMLHYKDGIIYELSKHKIFFTKFEGYRAAVLNIPMAGSDYFKYLDESQYDIMIVFSYNGRQWTHGIYTEKDDIDVSKIALKYGGGGHKKASGFTTDKCIF